MTWGCYVRLTMAIHPGKHIALLFVQYTPYEPKVRMLRVIRAAQRRRFDTLLCGQNGSWDTPGRKEKFADQVFSVIEQYAPGFKSSVIGYDMLTVRRELLSGPPCFLLNVLPSTC